MRKLTYLTVSALIAILSLSVIVSRQATALSCGDSNGAVITNGYNWDGCPDNANWDGDNLNYNGEIFSPSGTPNGSVKDLGWDHYYTNGDPIGCSDYIALNGPPEQAGTASVIPTHVNVTYSGCRLFGSNDTAHKAITINGGNAKDGKGKQRTALNNRREGLNNGAETVCQQSRGLRGPSEHCSCNLSRSCR